MRVVWFNNFEDLSRYSEQWSRLAGDVPTRDWTWMSTWWRHYGPLVGDLFVLGVFDGDEPIGFAPWYLTRHSMKGRVIRQLGDEEVAADYVSILCLPEHIEDVVSAIADRLTGETPPETHNSGDLMPRWDLLELIEVPEDDQAMSTLVNRLTNHGCRLQASRRMSSWILPVFDDWDTYAKRYSKRRRKRLRQMLRNLDAWEASGELKTRVVRSPEELEVAFDIMVDLHQRRSRSLGRPGCYASRRFANFQRDVMSQLLSEGRLVLQWLEFEGRPIAADYQIAGGGTLYQYQAGVDPLMIDIEPGKLAALRIIQYAQSHDFAAIDFLRGDEEYKRMLLCEPRQLVRYRVVAGHFKARLRDDIWNAARTLRDWARRASKFFAGNKTPDDVDGIQAVKPADGAQATGSKQLKVADAIVDKTQNNNTL